MNLQQITSSFAPFNHFSPLVAESYRMGDAEVTRIAGESTYALDHPDLDRTLDFSVKADAFRRGAELVLSDIDYKFAAQVEGAHEDTPDVEVSDQGSVVLFRPRTASARQWIDLHVQDDALWFGNSLVVEYRYVPYLLEGMLEDGLRVA